MARTMAEVRVSITIDAPRHAVWAALEDIESHVTWMREAVALRFVSPNRRGTGTRFECDTKVGPIRLVDTMEITEWRPRRSMGVRHVGVVTGDGKFTLRRRRRGRTRFTWSERFRFPWWLGGPAGAAAAGVVLARIWRRNLETFRDQVERTSHSAG